ncbi:MAG: NAD(P)H-quinone oxidoreductase [Eubacteriales bacterium]|nr:NAD(P)H-quinone oxidoreductase [Clostridiales bacterium]MDD6932291.1 NAD(P)H-quinone oxidoreductase [Eubacteriales bacterium]MDY2602516.1 NAD(P)H-quinone oxidoreductase [Eubacteriales bacterium]
MKAVLVNEDRSLKWAEVPDPILGQMDCRIQIQAAALNRADLMQREGDYPPPPGCPPWMGLEVAGTIVEMGEGAREASSWQTGDRVCALLGGGGYAQYVCARYDMLMPVPRGCSMEEAAALPEAFATAYLNLLLEGGMQAGDTVLITGGNSGLASVMIPLARAFGARVITTVRTPEKAARIAPLQAHRVIVTSLESLEEALRQEAEAGHPVNVAIDCLGGETMGRCLPFLAHGARWIMIAALAGQRSEIDLKTIYVKNIRIIGSTLRSRTPAFKAELLKKLVKEVWPLVEAGRVRPTIHRILPITQAEAAQEILYRGENVGKVVLQVQ